MSKREGETEMSDPNTPRVLDVQSALQQASVAEIGVMASMVCQIVLLRDDELSSMEWEQLAMLSGLFDGAHGAIEAARIIAAGTDA